MTVETVYSRKVTLKEDVLSSYEKGYGMRVLEEHQRTRSSTHTVAEDSARQGLRQDSLIRWQGGMEEENRLRWPCYRKNLMRGKKYRPGSAVEPGRKEEVGAERSRGLRPVVLARKRAFRRKTFLALTELQ